MIDEEFRTYVHVIHESTSEARSTLFNNQQTYQSRKLKIVRTDKGKD